MTKVTILDPFELNVAKIELEKAILDTVLSTFPNHRIGNVFSRFNYETYRVTDSLPIRSTLENAIQSSTFSIVEPTPIDTRYKFIWSFGDLPCADVICKMVVKYAEFAETEVYILKIDIEVFGANNKGKVLKLIEEFTKVNELDDAIKEIVVGIASEYPKKETVI